MTPELARQLFYPALAAGLGLVVAGAVNALLRGPARLARAAAVAAGLVAAGGALAALDPDRLKPASVMAAVVATAVGLAVAAGRSTWTATVVRAAGRPRAAGGLTAAAGVLVAAAGIHALDWADDADASYWSQEQEDRLPVAMGTTPAAEARTDRGTPVPLFAPLAARSDADRAGTEAGYLNNGWAHRLIRRGPATDASTCHGWVFAAGRFSVRGADVPLVLDGNGYAAVARPAAGDLAVYRNESAVTHTAVVRAVLSDDTVLVEGKWGSMGVYLHPAGDSPYGPDVTYYRSPRAGHRLAGLPGDEPPSANAPAAKPDAPFVP